MIDPDLPRRLQAYDVAFSVVQRVAELPDRTSPSDWPEAMLVTGDELRQIVVDELATLDHLQQTIEPDGLKALEMGKASLETVMSQGIGFTDEQAMCYAMRDSVRRSGVAYVVCAMRQLIRQRREAEARIAALTMALRSIANNSCCTPCREAGLVAKAALGETTRCECRYPVPPTSPPRDEPFDVTYRCAKQTGHDGPHGSGQDFCLRCGASIPPRLGEGTCEQCDPVGVLKHRVEALIAALRTYGRHADQCPAVFHISLSDDERQAGWTTPTRDCTCGLLAALLAASEGTK